jgi:hypothetical protein
MRNDKFRHLACDPVRGRIGCDVDLDKVSADQPNDDEGLEQVANFPRMLAHKNDEYHKEFNRLIGIDDVYCREIGGTRVMDKSHGWQAWEDVFAIK